MMRRLVDRWRWLRSFGRRRELEDGLDDEIRFHVDRQTEKHLAAGMTPHEARRQALIRLGGIERTKEDTRDQFRPAWFDDLFRDVRYGRRALTHAPGFTAVTILILALGIGATTAMFSVVNGVLLRPLPYPEQHRLIEIVHEARGIGVDELFSSPAVYFGYRDYNRTLDAIGQWDWDSSPVTVTGAGEPESVRSLEVTHEVLAILGVTPVVGRAFSDADDRPGSTPTAMVSHGYGQRRFGGVSPVGQTLIVEGVPRRIIGVLPPSFRFFDHPADIFYPLQLVRANAAFPFSDGRAIARVKQGVTLDEANADAARMIPILAGEFGTSQADIERLQFSPKLRWLRDTVVGDLGETLWLLMATIGLLLLIACANVANLVLVRTRTRQPELVLRSALGAGWGALARVVVTESALLGLAGGVAGIAIAYVSLPLLLSMASDELPQVMAVEIDLTVLIAAFGTALGATLLFAVGPVGQLAMRSLPRSGALGGGSRSLTGGRDGHRACHLLVVMQVAMAFVLLIGSGLMIRTFYTLRNVDPGFREPDTIQVFQLTTPAEDGPAGDAAAAARRERMLRRQHTIVDRLAAVAGVQAIGFSAFDDGLPLDGDGRGTTVFVEGRPPTEGDAAPKELQFVSPGFFETLGTGLIAGRTFDWGDVHEDRQVALISLNLARREWGSARAALGRRIAPRRSGPWLEIVGVVADLRHNGLNQPAPEAVMLPAVATPTASFVIRSPRAGTADFLHALREAVWSVNGNLSPAGIQTMGDLYQRSMGRTSMTLVLLVVTGGIALALGLVGIYGVVSYAASQRRREIGVRLALGAGRGEVRRMFVRHALVLVGAGVAVGLGAAAALTRLMESQLFGVSPLDPSTHVAAAFGLASAAALASYISAQRGTSVDPGIVLRGE